MYFSVEDYLKIEKWLKLRSIKDTEFPLVQKLTPTSQIAIVQNDTNKKITVKEVIKYFDTSGLVLNLSVYNADNSLAVYDDINLALANCPSKFLQEPREQIIIFKNTLGAWEYYQSVATVPALMYNTAYWAPFNPQAVVTATLQDLSNAILEKFPEIVLQGIQFHVDGHDTNYITEYKEPTRVNPGTPIIIKIPSGTDYITLTTPSSSETIEHPSNTITKYYSGGFTAPKTFTLVVKYKNLEYTKHITATPVHPVVINGVNKGIVHNPTGGYAITLDSPSTLVISTNGPLTKIKINGLPIQTTDSHVNNKYTYTSIDTFIAGSYLVELV